MKKNIIILLLVMIVLSCNAEDDNSAVENNCDFLSEIISENILPLVDEGGASSILYITIKNISEKPHSYDETEVVKEYQVSISTEFKWYGTKEKTDLMTGTVSQNEIYFSDNYNGQLSSDDQIVREDAILKLNETLSEKIILKLTSDW
jgi:outer membrane lipopolysaccharide assembly protein LptE/RlpB